VTPYALVNRYQYFRGPVRLQVYPKYWHLSTEVLGVISQETLIIIALILWQIIYSRNTYTDTVLLWIMPWHFHRKQYFFSCTASHDTIVCLKHFWGRFIIRNLSTSLRHHYTFITSYFQQVMGNKIAIREILLSTQGFSSVRLPTKSMTHIRKYFTRAIIKHYNFYSKKRQICPCD
jgi:hypothetical protein